MGIDGKVLALGFGNRLARRLQLDYRVSGGIPFETGKLMPARGQRPGAPGRSIAVSGSQRSFLRLAYIGRLDRKSAAHVRVFNKFNMPPFISARA